MVSPAAESTQGFTGATPPQSSVAEAPDTSLSCAVVLRKWCCLLGGTISDGMEDTGQGKDATSPGREQQAHHILLLSGPSAAAT